MERWAELKKLAEDKRQAVHPVLGQRWIDLPEVKVRVVPVAPPHEAADLAVADTPRIEPKMDGLIAATSE